MSVDIKISNRPISYKYAINFLEKRVEGIKDKKKNDLFWILEHPTTYTAGARYQKKEILDTRLLEHRLIQVRNCSTQILLMTYDLLLTADSSYLLLIPPNSIQNKKKPILRRAHLWSHKIHSNKKILKTIMPVMRDRKQRIV